MNATARAEELPPMSVERGRSLRERREALKIHSVREMERLSGIPRGTISAAEHGGASEGTYQRIELWLSSQESGEDAPVVRPIGDPEERLMEVEVRGRGGFRIIVRGSVDNPEALADMAERLMKRGMSTPGNDEPEDD